MASGIAALIIMPLVGKLSDKIDKVKLFTVAAIWMMVVVVIYTNLSPVPFAIVMGMNILMMIGIMSRIVPAMALVTALPKMQDRGAFMSINSSLQQIAGGIAAGVGGMIVVQQTKTSPLQHYNTLGYVIVVIIILNIIQLYRVSNLIKARKHADKL
jgi:predicted MFS family arabinose efflux permease